MGRKTDSSFDDLLFDNDIGGDEGAVTLRISELSRTRGSRENPLITKRLNS